ncbi:hypothetical protein C8F01DRAFT_1263160 [Mycena amicta]|nr:hypothetical protein C8F01DRAFT_1263160 [Mycena amicta]
MPSKVPAATADALSTLVKSVVAALQSDDLDLAAHHAQQHLFYIPKDLKLDALLRKLAELQEGGNQNPQPYKIKISIQNAKLEIVQYVPTRSHERAGNFAAVIESQILVLAYAWAVGAPGPPPSTGLELTGSTTFTNGIDAKEGDSTLSPRTRGILDWPTVVVEAGYSESHAQLYRDADKWMVMSQGHAFPVFLVVIVKIYNPIRIEMEFFSACCTAKSHLPAPRDPSFRSGTICLEPDFNPPKQH